MRDSDILELVHYHVFWQPLSGHGFVQRSRRTTESRYFVFAHRRQRNIPLCIAEDFCGVLSINAHAVWFVRDLIGRRFGTITNVDRIIRSRRLVRCQDGGASRPFSCSQRRSGLIIHAEPPSIPTPARCAIVVA